MSVRVPVKPEMLAWALKRSGMESGTDRYERFSQWATGDGTPTFRQLEEFAKATHAPLGYLFLDEPPAETVPIPDFRTIGNSAIASPSADLLDTIYEAQHHQDWYRSYAVSQDLAPIRYVSSAAVDSPPRVVANEMREALDFGLERRSRFTSWEEALRALIDAIERLGVLVMVSGIVGSNTHRVLDPNEFRGFALVDPLASVIFVNNADTKAAQIFTMVHELAHVWLGESALSESPLASDPQNAHELWANQVAAEVLVPTDAIRRDATAGADLPELKRLARLYKVSTLVVLKRMHDASLLTWEEFQVRYQEELARLKDIMATSSQGGGNYYNTQPLRLSQRFARAVIVDTLEGRTLYRDASRLLGAAKRSTFEGLASKLGVA
ncbi:ImmA/IrrE family metallo-endopeptidase [Microbacterium sp. ZW T6_19]|uniref:ImmA/IrrE family metallo-endopeptidase n=1 Tax=Microbacterium sp. ZW T6_19 TaxID=3378082 RepID=UPI00385506DE